MDVSVLMPVRDAARTVGVAVRSVLRSRGVSFEVVCVNHRSTDTTASILAKHAVRVVNGDGAETLSAALELGRAACTAPLIARMDADDVMHPDRLAADVAHLRAHPAHGAVACRARVVPKGKARPGLRAYVAWQNACITADDHAREIWIEQPLLHPATTFRAATLATLGGWAAAPRHEPEDYDLFLRMVVAGVPFAKRPEVHHAWRQHASTSTRFDRDVLARMKARALVKRFSLAREVAGGAGRPVVIAGAGKEGGRIARALLQEGVRARAFLDVAARRIGRLRHGVPVLDARELPSLKGNAFVVAAIGTSGARGVVRAQLADAGFVEAHDCVVVA